jgi:hypothetical protein
MTMPDPAPDDRDARERESVPWYAREDRDGESRTITGP